MTLPIHMLTTRELAAVLKRSPETLVRWRRLRVGPPFHQIQGRVLYRQADVAEWIRSCSASRNTAIPAAGRAA